MKWKIPEEPNLGDQKTDIRFAFFPTRMTDGYTVWLERYRVHLLYGICKVPTKFFMTVDRKDWRVVQKEALFL